MTYSVSFFTFHLHTFVNWLEGHSEAASFIFSALGFVATLFKPATWRRLVAAIAVGLGGFVFVPYEPARKFVWGSKAVLLAVIFNGAFWFALGKARAWRAKGKTLPMPPSGTFEAVTDTVRQMVAESGDSSINVRVSTASGTIEVKKVPPHRRNT